MKNIYKVLAILFLASCVDPATIEVGESDEIIVVSGFITTEEGPHRVELSRTAKFGSVFDGVITKVTGATVLVRDSEGQVVEFDEVLDGIYESPAAFRAEVGETYTLQIETNLGVSYSSLPQTVVDGPEIQELEIRYRRLPSSDPTNFVSGVEVYSVFDDPAGERNFYFWGIEGTYVVKTFPELFVIQGDPDVAAPKDCCDRCWLSENNVNTTQLLSDDQLDGERITSLAGLITDDGQRYTERYYANVQQYSLNEEAFNFYSLVASQVSIDGDLFDPPPARIRGNIINLDDPTEEIIGFFGAFSIQERSVFIDRSFLDDTQRLVQINDDCLTLPTATIEQPSFWE